MEREHELVPGTGIPPFRNKIKLVTSWKKRLKTADKKINNNYRPIDYNVYFGINMYIIDVLCHEQNDSKKENTDSY